MKEELNTQTFQQTKQVWSIIRHFDNVDLDQIKLEIYDPETNTILIDINWDAKDFFKKMVDLQYQYAR
jgi:hypothetical protein